MSLVKKFLEDVFLPYDRNYTISMPKKKERPHAADFFYIKVLTLDSKDGCKHETGYVGRDSTPEKVEIVPGTYNYMAKEFSDEEVDDFLENAEPLPPNQEYVPYRPTIFPKSWY